MLRWISFFCLIFFLFICIFIEWSIFIVCLFCSLGFSLLWSFMIQVLFCMKFCLVHNMVKICKSTLWKILFPLDFSNSPVMQVVERCFCDLDVLVNPRLINVSVITVVGQNCKSQKPSDDTEYTAVPFFGRIHWNKTLCYCTVGKEIRQYPKAHSENCEDQVYD